MRFIIFLIILSTLISCKNDTEILSFLISDDEITMYSNQETQLMVSVSYSGKDSPLLWSSSDEKVATVDADGNVTAHHPGQAVISVTFLDQVLTCNVTVEQQTFIALSAQTENSGNHSLLILRNGEELYSSGTLFDSYPYAIAINKDNVFVSGHIIKSDESTVVTRACYWKDGVINLIDGDDYVSSKAYGLTVNSDTLYICGNVCTSNSNKGVIWKGGKEILSIENVELSDVVFNESGYIVCGTTSDNRAALYINGIERVLLSEENSRAMYLAVDDDVYVGGSIYRNGIEYATIWKNNDVMFQASFESSLSGINVIENKVIACGNAIGIPFNRPFIVDNNQVIYLPADNAEIFTTSISSIDDDVYVTGRIEQYKFETEETVNSPVMWENGSMVSLGTFSTNTYPIAIAIR